MTLAIALAAGAVIGILLGLLGGGGSILSVPVLVFALGLDIDRAVPISLIVVGVASAVGAVPKVRAHLLQWRLAAVFAAAGIPPPPSSAALRATATAGRRHGRVRRRHDRSRCTYARRPRKYRDRLQCRGGFRHQLAPLRTSRNPPPDSSSAF